MQGIPSHIGAQPEINEVWEIGGDREAEWAMRKTREAQQALTELQQQADEYRAEIDAWLEDASKSHERDSQFFSAKLIEYHERRLGEGGPKSLRLPSGQVRSTDRRNTARLSVEDADVFVQWAYENLPEEILGEAVVEQAPKVLPSKLGKQIKAVQTDDNEWVVVDVDGQPVPGLQATPGNLTFTVKPGE